MATRKGVVGDLLVQVRADLGTLRTDIREIERSFNSSFANLQRSAVSFGKGIAGGLIGGLFVGALASFTKGIIDLVSYLLLFFPTMITMFLISVDDALNSFTLGERSQESIWRVIMWPFRASIPLSAVLFVIQGVSETLKCCYQIRFGREFVHREKIEV